MKPKNKKKNSSSDYFWDDKEDFIPDLNVDINETISIPSDFITSRLYMDKSKGYSRRTYINYNKERINVHKNLNHDFRISYFAVIFDYFEEVNIDDHPEKEPPENNTDTNTNTNRQASKNESKPAQPQLTVNPGQFIYKTEEGFADSVPSGNIEPVRHSHHIAPAHNQTPDHTNTSSIQSKADISKSYYSSMFTPVYSRPSQKTSTTQVPMLIVTHMAGIYRPIFKEFPNNIYPRLHIFSCPNYKRNAFLPLPTEVPPPPPAESDTLRFNPPKIEVCELCRETVRNPAEHRASEVHKRRSLDTKWDTIDMMADNTRRNLINWPYQPITKHSTS